MFQPASDSIAIENKKNASQKAAPNDGRQPNQTLRGFGEWKFGRVEPGDTSDCGTAYDMQINRIQPKMHVSGQTDVGLKRKNNEDAFLIADLSQVATVTDSNLSFGDTQIFGAEQGKMLLVADGIGGARAGEVASRLAISSAVQFFLNAILRLNYDSIHESIIEQLIATVHHANEEVIQAAEESNGLHRGMGTTLTAAVIFWPKMYVLHVGDSRCYHLPKNERIELVTVDQTIGEYLVQTGAITQQECDEFKYGHALFSAVGGEVFPKVFCVDLSPGDQVLLCSDGLNAHVDDLLIQNTLENSPTPQEACSHLVDSANSLGGRDNITVVAAMFDG